PVRGAIQPPGSKSITNRALACAALAEGVSMLTGALDSEDTQVMIAALHQLGIAIEADLPSATLRVEGCGGGIPSTGGELYVANSGTTIRFLAALVALGRGEFRLDGTPRMRERPIGDLVEALRQLGADAESEGPNGCPPVVIRAHGLPGGPAKVRGDVSSQFLSGLLMAAPYAERPVELSVAGTLVSQPYVRMTLAVMSAFGVEVPADDLSHFRLPAGVKYRGRNYAIEPDASAASYFFAAAAITGGEVTVEGLSRESLQGDVAFVEVLEKMGCRVTWGRDRITVAGGSLKGVDVDMNAISDTVQTLGAVAIFANGPTTVRGVGHIRHKETDRIGALATELRKLGATVDERSDGLKITPAALHGAAIDTYQDHRMAMSLALVGLRIGGVVIRDPGCTAKTYPRFFEDLERLTAGSA
ncbi:MAG TPA: 3-phosphoshikimate 1-carboxyvinyltransferase, partial [Pirellulales bacterium]|nr:3-phosphoshikimate 1-carboxyvinyltransferase [Pirellulales bacterium]